MLKIAVRGLPPNMTPRRLEKMFSEHGNVFRLEIQRDIFSGHCKGRAEIHMEGHEARAAMDALDGKTIEGSTVRLFSPRKKRKRFV